MVNDRRIALHILEIVHSVNGDKRQYDCELLLIDEEKAVIKYIRERKHDIGVAILPRGGITKAIYWKNRNFNVLKMYSENKKLMGYYINICEAMQISKEQISWRDLVLDLWITDSGNTYWLDEDEVKKYKLLRLLSEEQLIIIQRTRQYLEKNYKDILLEANKIYEKGERQKNRH